MYAYVNETMVMALTRLHPIIVCGMPRSGTRMMTDVLNGIDGVCVQNEMPGPVIQSYFDFAKDIDVQYVEFAKRNRRRNGKLWTEHQAAVAFAFFIFGSKMGPILEGEEITHIGMKTPGFERYYKDFERLFSVNPPQYLYTFRNPEDNWKSIKSMGYYSDVNLYKTRYIRSLRNAIKIRNICGDRFTLFNLDKFKDAKDQGEYLKSYVVSSLGLDNRVPDFSKLAKTENRNRLTRSGNKRIDDDTIIQECNILKKDEDIKSYISTLLN